MSKIRHPWALVIFACRESLPQLRQTLGAARVSASACAVIHVLVNGNPALASALGADLSQQQASKTRTLKDIGAGTSEHSDLGTGHGASSGEPAIKVWSISLADKANAWNQYIHHLWAGEAIAFFIDGYVRLQPDAVELLGCAVEANAQALGGSGVPTMGRSAKALRENMIVNTGYHGNFCCLKGDTIRQMQEKQARLPMGLYRTDSLMGAFLSYALDPGQHLWEDYRIHVHPTASWWIDPARWWRFKDLLAFARRYQRQIRGKLENAAFTDHLANRLCSPATLPPTAQELVLEWVGRCPTDYQRLAKSYWLAPWVLQRFRQSPPVSGDPHPRLIWPHEP